MDHRAQRVNGDRNRSDRAKKAVALLAVSVLGACSSGGAPDDGVSDEAGRAIEVAGQSSAALRLPEAESFVLTRDLRKCAAPLCGGYWVRAVNRLATRCADGSVARRCYVAEADFRSAGGEPALDGAGVVVRGELQSNVFPEFGELGRFVASAAWSPASTSPARGAYFRVGDNGVRCVTEPCFSTASELLNTGVAFNISDLDLSRVGASNEQLEAANAALAQGALIVTGVLALRSGQAGLGIELEASQFYLPSAERCYSDADCAAGQSCNAGEVCLPPPGCSPGLACPAVCTGYCVDASQACATDADCAAGNWCRVTESGSYGCTPFATEGDRCNGFTVPWMYEQCSPELTCDVPEFVADVPGVCRPACRSEADCETDEYCASDGLCHADATCDLPLDCLASGNTYTQILCVGYPVCPAFGDPQQGQCGWQCGDPRCIDVAGDFGPCDQVLGWGRSHGTCMSISGCDAGGAQLFASQAECEAACPE